MFIVENTFELGHYVSVTLLCRLTSTCQLSITMQCKTVSTDAPTSYPNVRSVALSTNQCDFPDIYRLHGGTNICSVYNENFFSSLRANILLRNKLTINVFLCLSTRPSIRIPVFKTKNRGT